MNANILKHQYGWFMAKNSCSDDFHAKREIFCCMSVTVQNIILDMFRLTVFGKTIVLCRLLSHVDNNSRLSIILGITIPWTWSAAFFLPTYQYEPKSKVP